jgi:uncharacterized protein YbjQ (UPF0145 family)
MLVTTTSVIEGKRIVRYIGLVTGEAIMGAKMLKDLFASLRDTSGRMGSYEREFRRAKDIAIEEMKEQCRALGGNAIVGTNLGYATIGPSGGVILVSTSGTAVFCEDVA